MVFPGMLVWRFGIFLHIFIAAALDASFGNVTHLNHFLVYVSFALLFLPAAAGRPDRMPRSAVVRCITAFWFAQCIPLFCYSLSGLWKVLFSGPELLASDGFVRIVLHQSPRERCGASAGPVPGAARASFPVSPARRRLHGGLRHLRLVQTALHRPFGVLLILLHLGTGWLLNVVFVNNLVVLGIFMVFSPFAPRRSSWFAAAQSLPLLGIPFRASALRSSAPHRRRPVLPRPRVDARERGAAGDHRGG